MAGIEDTYDYWPGGMLAKNIKVYSFAWYMGDIGFAGWDPHSFSPGEQTKIEHQRPFDRLNFHDGSETAWLTARFLPPDRRTSRSGIGLVKLTLEVTNGGSLWEKIAPTFRDNEIPVYVDGSPAFNWMYDVIEEMKMHPEFEGME